MDVVGFLPAASTRHSGHTPYTPQSADRTHSPALFHVGALPPTSDEHLLSCDGGLTGEARGCCAGRGGSAPRCDTGSCSCPDCAGGSSNAGGSTSDVAPPTGPNNVLDGSESPDGKRSGQATPCIVGEHAGVPQGDGWKSTLLMRCRCSSISLLEDS